MRPGYRAPESEEAMAMAAMKALNMQMEDRYHDDLEAVRAFYSEEQGVRFSKSMALKKLLHESASAIRATGALWPARGQDQEQDQDREGSDA